MNCPDCGAEMGDPVDTTYSNVTTGRARVGQHTGDIYSCEKCELRWLDDFLSQKVVVWHG
jgi:hypothetical protein